MAKRLLLTSAGTGASNNLVRSLRAGDPSLFIIGCHDDRFILKNSAADRNYVIPRSRQVSWTKRLAPILAMEKVDVVIPTTDIDVEALSRIRRQLVDRLFLPRHDVIELCHDKYKLIQFLRAEGIDVPTTFPVTDLKHIDGLFRRLGSRVPVWCRIRTGTGSMGALAVSSPEEARNWIRCWEALRGVPATSFTLSEYLPGRDFGCQSVWRDGELILIKTYERLSYLATGGQPSQVSSVAALAKTVFAPHVVETSAEAIHRLDKKASGVFSVDLKERASGVPCITEINAGRFSSATNIFDLCGKHNMATTYVRLALGEPVDIAGAYDFAEDYYMLRDLDALPVIAHADAFFDTIDEVPA